MAHLRQRDLADDLKDLLKLSPLVGLLGHRQVGKTTLLESLCAQYFTFDDEATLNRFEEDPKTFITQKNKHPVGLDECQTVPRLFPALKELVRTNKRPGQFILSGSVRFTSRKAIRESLTGRIMNLELLPFTAAEIIGLPLSNSIQRLMNVRWSDDEINRIVRPSYDQTKLKKETSLYLERGGLPGILFIRGPRRRLSKINDQLDTILDRDLRMIQSTTLSLTQIKEYLAALAQNEGEPIKYSKFQKLVRISEVTQKKLLYSFEALFLIRRIPIGGDNNGFSIVFEDQAESLYLSQNTLSLQRQYESFLYRNLRAQWMYRKAGNIQVSQYLTRGGTRVPIVIKSGINQLGFIITLENQIDRSIRAQANSFLAKVPDSKIIVTGPHIKTQLIETRFAALPISGII
jgi:predicted AAA+ superfamily ATPase